jgi:UDP-N-acetylmuramate dehydrogenase
VTGLSEEEWFISATCRMVPGDKDKSLQLIKELLDHRAQTQPTSEYNCGSVFKNPTGNYAAKLIESCGLKGFSLGGAKVSTKHANFIINHEGIASALDIEQLIQHVRKTVLEKTSIELLHEIHILGDE